MKKTRKALIFQKESQKPSLNPLLKPLSKETERQSGNTDHPHKNLYVMLEFSERSRIPESLSDHMACTRVDQLLGGDLHTILDKTEADML